MGFDSIGDQDSILVLQYHPEFGKKIQNLLILPKHRIYLTNSNFELIETYTNSLTNPFGIFSQARFKCILIDFFSNFSKASSELSEIQHVFEVLPPAVGIFKPSDNTDATGFEKIPLSQQFFMPVNDKDLNDWISTRFSSKEEINSSSTDLDQALVALSSVPIFNLSTLARLDALAKKQNFPLLVLLDSYTHEMGFFIRKLALNVSLGKREESQWIILSIKSLSRVIGAEQISALAASMDILVKQPDWKQILTHIPELHLALKVLKDFIAKKLNA